MSRLRLRQTTTAENRHSVHLTFESDDSPPREATAEFSFEHDAEDREDFRWYLEDYLQCPLKPDDPNDPEWIIAQRVEARLAEMGQQLFDFIFRDNEDAREIWTDLSRQLADTRVEIITDVEHAAAIPWELIHDHRSDVPLALGAKAFVRASHQAVVKAKLPRTESGPIRILLVICRPGAGEDVPFRSVAVRLLKGLDDAAREALQLDVLRPPTFERLAEALNQARDAGQPYHVVHFDGHGAFLDMEDLFEQWKKLTEDQWTRRLADLVNFDDRDRFSPQAVYPHTPRGGHHGHLAFENTASALNLRLVGGRELGKLLVETDVPVVVLNACRSAYAEAPEEPQPPGSDVHDQIRAYGSFAQEVMDAGTAGVVAMRYNVYVVTAAQFVADLYAALTRGYTLGQAVTFGRKQLHANPVRRIAYQERPLQDWPVPVVFEAVPVELFPEPAEDRQLEITLDEKAALPKRGHLDPKLPARPDVGFLGRDETLLALDRAFDTQSVVLLHAYAGSGKTATAAEFARWYASTGGLEGPVLFTSFEQYRPLPQVLSEIERVFGPSLEGMGIHWLTLEDAQRREVALQVLQQVPVLWIWDNVEPVAGLPTGTDSAWSEPEQAELVDFLRAARETKAKFLLTSRRDERAWLGDLPMRITVPPMPMQERVQFTRALAERLNRRITDVADWRPLLRFTEGNPLAITVLVGQALRDGLTTRDQIEAFVEKLRTGEAKFKDEESEGRTRSLGASLNYGFEHAFDGDQRKRLALLHLFQGFVNVDVLRTMGNPEPDWCLPEVRGLTREAGIALLDRAAEIGLLTAHGDGYYSIHPALPWFFKSLFDLYYPAPTDPEPATPNPQSSALRAFVEAMGELGNYYHQQYEHGNRDVIGALTAEEANLLHARRLARNNGWWHRVTSTMQGLRVLYGHTGRRSQWARLVDEIVPDFVDPTSGGPLPGREEEWTFVTLYRVRLAREARQWPEAECLQRVRMDWDRQRAAVALAAPSKELDAAERNALRTLAASLHELGQIRREQQAPDCAAAYEESLELSERIGERAGAATCALNLGHAYMVVPALRDLEKAEEWYQRSLEQSDERDRLGRGQCHNQLGAVAHERFHEARAANQPKEELVRHLNAALNSYLRALDMLPPNAVNDLAVTHNQLGLVYQSAGDTDRALENYRESIRCQEAQGNRYDAGGTRFNVATVLASAGRFEDALAFARAALRDFEAYGDRAASDIQKAKGLITRIEELQRAQEG